MADYILQRTLTVPRPLAAVFDFFSQAGNLETLTPPWLHFKIVTPQPITMRQGATIAYELRVRGIPVRWLTEIELWRPPYEFVDIQLRGPYGSGATPTASRNATAPPASWISCATRFLWDRWAG
ncbi:MAG TPA: SRPBCC family protein [Bryobacteraceae bacterium]|nr:SRPBCC family protein [Bryobacteraceae bacterium]